MTLSCELDCCNGPMRRLHDVGMLREQRETDSGRAGGRAQHYTLNELSGSVAATRTFDDVDDAVDEDHNDADDDADADNDDDNEVDDAPAYLALRLQLQSVRKPEAVRRFSLGQRAV